MSVPNSVSCATGSSVCVSNILPQVFLPFMFGQSKTTDIWLSKLQFLISLFFYKSGKSFVNFREKNGYFCEKCHGTERVKERTRREVVTIIKV